jgi:putative nucleotidyltransferase with HDIG domain
VSAPSLAETFLRELQSAVSSRRLYAAEHPRNVVILDRLEAHVKELTAGRTEFSALSDADRLVTDDGLVESHTSVARGIFAALHQRGFDRLTVVRGLGRAELSAFIETMATLEGGGTAVLAPSPHLTFTRLVRQMTPGATAGLGAWVGGGLELDGGSSGPLEQVWLSIDKGPVQLEILEGLVLALSQTVTHNREALIPLVALQSHDAYTVTHITNVAVVSMSLAAALGFSPAFVHDCGTAALLHDVGKLKVPPDVLSSPTKLTEAQLVLMKRHPEDGARMLMNIGRLPELATIVAFEHHIQYDGGGYPTVPPGWQVHVASEITHIADVYDALRSDRPYRKGLPPEVAAQMMNADTGRVFDPYVLKVFFEQVAPRLTWRAAAEPISPQTSTHVDDTTLGETGPAEPEAPPA